MSDVPVLRVRPLRFGFRAIDPIAFPRGGAANTFRGAFGEIFRRIACLPDCPGAKLCSKASECVYARMFEPQAPHEHPAPAERKHPSGFQDRPRPFVLRAASLNGRHFEPGERFTLDVNVFDTDIPACDYFRRAFGQLCEEGLGPRRPRIELMEAAELPGVEVDLVARRQAVERVTVTFLTPTELKSGGSTLREPPFDALFRRARDRVTGLMALYQAFEDSGQLDFRGMGARAAAIQMTNGRFEQVEYERRSARTRQLHSLGGFVGEAEYEGDLAEFLPYLEAAWWTGVGRLTVWGNGMVRVTVHA